MSDPDAPSEDGSKRDGVLSYAAEWHALALGVYHGLTSAPLRAPEVPDNPDVKKEPHYYKGGYVIGTLLQVALIVLLGAGTAPHVLPLFLGA